LLVAEVNIIIQKELRNEEKKDDRQMLCLQNNRELLRGLFLRRAMRQPELECGQLLSKEGGWPELGLCVPVQQCWQLQQAHLRCHVPCLSHKQ
jgi:hypothetical protein